MKKLFFISLCLLFEITASAGHFAKQFCDSTLRIDISIAALGDRYALSVDSIRQTDGWFGRRANLSTTVYNESLKVSVIDKATRDTIYVETKYLEASPLEYGSTAYTCLFVPKPRHASEIEITAYSPSETGLEKWQSVYEHLSDAKLKNLVSEPKSDVPYSLIRRAFDDAHAINLAIVAEGYTADEMESFMEKARQLNQSLFSQPAFSQHADKFNVVAVMLPSLQSGITIPSQDLTFDSSLHSHFDSFGLERLLTVPDIRLLWDELSSIPACHVLILANTDKYGGSGTYNDYAIAAANIPNFDGVIIHEFGHSFASLADEYESGYSINYTSDVEPQEANITTMADFSRKWPDLIESGEAGLIEGAGYQEKGVWRGCEHCLMRAIGDSEFCPVCAREINRFIEFQTDED